MLTITVWLSVGVFVWGFASCSITCPDGSVCSDINTCCLTKHGYSCCPYPNEEENNHVPDQESSIVHCDNYYTCPNGYSCCRHLAGGWYCCPYSPGWCCRDGFHCCPYGFDCDYTFTHCVRRGLRYPFTPKQSLGSVPASLISTSEVKSSSQETPMTALTEASNIINIPEAAVIRCDSKFYCPSGSTCCKGPEGNWICCPYPLGACCQDGKHCCEHGYNCDPKSMSCRRWYS